MSRFAPSPDEVMLRALHWEWGALNGRLLRGALRRPVFGLSDAQQRLGSWNARDRCITIARSLLRDRPWGEVREVLAHEVAHQYASEVLGAVDEPAHGRAFQRACERMGIGARAGGPLRGLPEGPDEPKVLRKIRKLLALAQSPNEHEARLAAAKAQRLMLENNLAEAETGAPLVYAARQLGPVKGRFQAHEKVLAGLLSEHFFVECIWMQGCDVNRGLMGRYLEIIGTPENLELAAWVHAYLLETAERLWAVHKRRQGIRGNAERRRYLAGVMAGFREQLRGQAKLNREEGLVWVGDPDLRGFFERRHPYVQKRRGPRIRATDAWHHGKAAGREIVLRKPVGAAAGKGGRLLEG